MKSLKTLAAEKVEWYRLENTTGVDTGPLTRGSCCLPDPDSDVDPVEIAIEKGHARCLEEIAETSLAHVKLAVRAGRLDIVRLVWKKFPDANHSALVKAAASYQKPAILRWALRLLPPNQQAIDDAISLAALRGNVACFELLLDLRPALSLASAIKGGNSDIVDMTLARVSSIDARDFALAAKLGSVRALEAMLRYGDAWDESTPRAASVHGHVECLRFAHENGCRWSTTALATTHEKCLAYALKHGCGGECEECPRRSRNRFETGGTFPVNRFPVDDDRDRVDEKKRSRPAPPGLEAQRATLFHMLRRGENLPAFLVDAILAVQPERSLKKLLAFKFGTVELKAQDVAGKKKIPSEKTLLDAIRLEKLAYRYETGAENFARLSETVFFYSESALGVACGLFDATWHPEEDVVRLQRINRRASISRSKFFVGRQPCHPIFNVASFLFQRPLYDALSIVVAEGTFCFEAKGSLKPRGGGCSHVDLGDARSFQHFDSMERLLNHFPPHAPQDSGVKVDDEPLPPEPDLATKFVMFLRRHGVAVRDSLTGLLPARSLWRAREAFAVDHYVLADRTMHDRRSRMSVNVDDLVADLKRLPHDSLYAVVFIFSLPIIELNDVYRGAPRSDSDDSGSRHVRVSALDYCRHAIVA